MKTAVLICPGRGSYTKAELGSLARFPDRELLTRFDARRRAEGQDTLSDLDGTATEKDLDRFLESWTIRCERPSR